MVTKLYFVRHADPNYDNHNDYERELSAKGLLDRHLVSDFLKDKPITAVFSSPYVRAVETIRPFAESRRLSIQVDDDFRERRITDQWIADFKSFSEQQWQDFSYKLEGGESLSEVQERNIRALERLLVDFAGQELVIGSHGTALSTIIHYFDPSFSYVDFEKIKGLMPWLVCLTFEGQHCLSIESINLFEKKTR
ncbi:histidine phosphatase family protein [Streptococcus saliviloxodontae]|uniref:2,3-bisphosphoglycerate-dependent phosphoglycerate mutase n=1 Tax=Streptococcus saliviloxodontae TaxID=1349416 RepID=A0ABS2PLI3_9STRE|nr:histidine phosphatase family protein [Streptococcus saliviloxodontae]MBM7635811.1 2,3-bisphosphoglycerate-dependent phosphoglycerate mutase [Streptococcus saliviloxodontae]